MADKSEQILLTTCNRRPFLSDSGCNRGNVDVNQFNDFPFCDSIDPRVPEVPPEVLDFPLVLPVPPACACVNIEHKIDFKYNEKKEFKASASFAAKSDCCEGNYQTNLNLQIPCPIDKKESGAGKIKVKIGYGSGPTSASASFINADPDSCTIEPLAPEIDLNIPCPVKGEPKPKVKASIKYGNGKNSASAQYASADPESCDISLKDATLDLQIPCPVKGEPKPKVKASIKYGNGKNSASASYASTDSKSCTIGLKSASLDLQIPCPIKKGDSPQRKFKISVQFAKPTESWQSSWDAASESYANVPQQERAIRNFNASKRDQYSDRSETVHFMAFVNGAGEISFDGVTWDVLLNADVAIGETVEIFQRAKTGESLVSIVKNGNTVPGPYGSSLIFDTSFYDPIYGFVVVYKFTGSGGVDGGDGRKVSRSVQFAYIGKEPQARDVKRANEDGDSCELNLKDMNINLKIPCPVKKKDANKSGYPKIRVRYKKSRTESSSFSSSYVEIDSSTCEARFKSVELDLRNIIGGNVEPFELVDCCVQEDNFYFDGQLKHAAWKSASGCGDPEGGQWSVFLICKGTRIDDSGSTEEYTWEFWLSRTAVSPASSREKVLSIKLYDLDGCSVVKDYRGVNLPVFSGGVVTSTLDDFGPFRIYRDEYGNSCIGEGYVQVGGFTVHVSGDYISTTYTVFAVKVHVGSSGSISAVTQWYSDMGSLQQAQSDLDYVIVPVYIFKNSGTEVEMDLRRMPMTGMLEIFLG